MGRMGRKSKGPRELLGCRPSERLAQAVRREAAAHSMSISAYITTVLADKLHMPEEAPEKQGQAEELPLTG